VWRESAGGRAFFQPRSRSCVSVLTLSVKSGNRGVCLRAKGEQQWVDRRTRSCRLTPPLAWLEVITFSGVNSLCPPSSTTLSICSIAALTMLLGQLGELCAPMHSRRTQHAGDESRVMIMLTTSNYTHTHTHTHTTLPRHCLSLSIRRESNNTHAPGPAHTRPPHS
jgi:hypothetical protein